MTHSPSTCASFRPYLQLALSDRSLLSPGRGGGGGIQWNMAESRYNFFDPPIGLCNINMNFSSHWQS